MILIFLCQLWVDFKKLNFIFAYFGLIKFQQKHGDLFVCLFTEMRATLCLCSLGWQDIKQHCFIHTVKQNILTENQERVGKVIFFALSFRAGCEPQNFVGFSQNSYVKFQTLTLSKSKYLEAGNLYKNIFPLDLSNTMSSARLHPGEFWPTM